MTRARRVVERRPGGGYVLRVNGVFGVDVGRGLGGWTGRY